MPAPRPRPHPDLDLALAAAHGAGKILREAFGKRLPVEYKTADQPVTEADLEADRFLRGALCGPRPAYGWVSEETAAAARTPDASCVWVVDPLDGTTSFIAERPEFAISIGLVERGTPVLGVVYNPMAEEMYHAVRGEGAFRGEAPIRASSRSAAPLTLIASRTELERGGHGDLPAGWRVIPLGSTAMKIVRVAEGVADAYLSVGRKEIWDVCGGAVIAEAAGAELLTRDGEPLRLSLDAATYTDGLVVVSSAARAAVLRVLKRGG